MKICGKWSLRIQDAMHASNMQEIVIEHGERSSGYPVPANLTVKLHPNEEALTSLCDLRYLIDSEIKRLKRERT